MHKAFAFIEGFVLAVLWPGSPGPIARVMPETQLCYFQALCCIPLATRPIKDPVLHFLWPLKSVQVGTVIAVCIAMICA